MGIFCELWSIFIVVVMRSIMNTYDYADAGGVCETKNRLSNFRGAIKSIKSIKSLQVLLTLFNISFPQ